MVVSIITPVLNGRKYIGDCLESVIHQSYSEVEHVVVDGGSKDGTVELLLKYQSEYPNKITFVSYPDTVPGSGPGQAWNKGIAVAKGAVLGWLGADDMLAAPDVVRTVTAFFEANPNAAFVHGECNYIDERNELLFVHRTREFTVSDLLNVNNYVACPSAFYRAEVIKAVGGVDDYGNDYEFMVRIAKAFSMHRIEKPLSSFRAHRESETGDYRRLKRVVYLDYLASRKHGGAAFSHFARRYYKYRLIELFGFGRFYYPLREFRRWLRDLLRHRSGYSNSMGDRGA